MLQQHAADRVDLVFSNAGIGGGGSFVSGGREEWERTFAVDWWGVYYCARTFLPQLIASGDAVLVNTSSVNGFLASLRPGARQPISSTREEFMALEPYAQRPDSTGQRGVRQR